MKNKKNRRLKVYGQSNGYDYKEVPTIILKGRWLIVAGFDIGTDLLVECGNHELKIRVVLPDGDEEQVGKCVYEYTVSAVVRKTEMYIRRFV